MKIPLTLTLVKWQDSKQPTSGWVFSNEIPSPSIVFAETVGYVVKETYDVLVLAQTVANVDLADEQVNGCMQIPKRCITERIELAWCKSVDVNSIKPEY